MEEWDQDKLESVVKQKHGIEKNRPTDIICKFFLDAVERKQYGWCAWQSVSIHRSVRLFTCHVFLRCSCKGQ